ncbi:MAG: hypothetical protein NVSMB3_08720 [Acidobacteriaceae bacterium]
MQRFCDDLRSERERRNISLETIGEVTKVPSRYLQALESGDYTELPSGVFRKGILRGYLTALAMDELPWMQRFEATLAAAGEGAPSTEALAEFAVNVSRSRPASPAVQNVRWLGATGMVLVVGLLGWCLWHFVLQGRVLLSTLLPH